MPIHQMTGFTLIETLVVAAILIFIITMGAPVTLDFYRNYQIAGERNSFIALLRQARSQSMVHTANSSHGIYIGSDSYTLFEGTSYGTRNQSADQQFPRASNISITGNNEVCLLYTSPSPRD